MLRREVTWGSAIQQASIQENAESEVLLEQRRVVGPECA